MESEVVKFIAGFVMLVFGGLLAMFWKRIDKIEAAANIGISADETRKIAREEFAALDSKIESLRKGIESIQAQQSQLMFHLMSSKNND